MLRKRKCSCIIKFIEYLNTEFDLLDKPNKSIYRKGDFNVNLLNIDADQLTADFYQTLISYSLIPTITKPTRITHHTATLIDDIFTNDYIAITIRLACYFPISPISYGYFLQPNCAPKK